LIGDKRNNENQIVGQLQLAFLKFHNATVDWLQKHPAAVDDLAKSLPNARSDLFGIAQRLVRYHYQWIVLTDFLGRIAKPSVLEAIYPGWKVAEGVLPGQDVLRKPRLTRYLPHKLQFPFMPVEFAVAAYRFGHSMVRHDYALNTQHHPTGKEVPIFAHFGEQTLDLRGFAPLAQELVIEWQRFFGNVADDPVQPARAIDTLIVSGLAELPAVVAPPPMNSLPLRNLLRGAALGLPSGQDVARNLELPEDRILGTGAKNAKFTVPADYKTKAGERDPSLPDLDAIEAKAVVDAFGDKTPLWYYVLKEAEVFENGQRLGEVGSRIVAETFVGLMAADPSSFVNNSRRSGDKLVSYPWTPQQGLCGCTANGRYTMVDLLKFAGTM
jgi:hypothetical protein